MSYLYTNKNMSRVKFKADAVTILAVGCTGAT